MNKYLQAARRAMDRPGRSGGVAHPEEILAGMHEAMEAILEYLEELDGERNVRPAVTIYKPGPS